MHDAACLVARMHKASAAQPPGPTGRGIVAAKCRRASFGVVCGPCLHIYTLQTLPLHDTPAQAAHPGYRACVIARLVARQARVRILAAVKGQEHHEQRLLSASAHVVARRFVARLKQWSSVSYTACLPPLSGCCLQHGHRQSSASSSELEMVMQHKAAQNASFPMLVMSTYF